MKKKKLSKQRNDSLASKIDLEGFWYALLDGYLIPEDVLNDEEDIARVKNAIEILKEFENICPTI